MIIEVYVNDLFIIEQFEKKIVKLKTIFKNVYIEEHKFLQLLIET